jgi:glycosyltransferase involved in cell wall biosynthesis
VADKAALVADPKDEEDIAEKILEVFNNSSTRIRLVREGIRRVKDFSWEKTAKETLEVYRKVANG